MSAPQVKAAWESPLDAALALIRHQRPDMTWYMEKMLEQAADLIAGGFKDCDRDNVRNGEEPLPLTPPESEINTSLLTFIQTALIRELDKAEAHEKYCYRTTREFLECAAQRNDEHSRRLTEQVLAGYHRAFTPPQYGFGSDGTLVQLPYPAGLPPLGMKLAL